LLFSARSFRRLQEAISWGRWDEVLRKLASLRNRIPPDAAAFYEAQALAGLGRTDEGLRVWARFSGAPQLPDWMHWARLSEIYATAQDREAALAALERAAVLAPENPVVLLSLARTVLLFHKDTCRARVLLNAARSHELSDVMVSMLAMVEGMLGVEEGRAHEAIGRLEDSLTGITPLAHNPATGPGIANIHAYLALAHAAVRDLKSAEEHFRLAEPRLRALRQKEMLSRCHDILGLPAGCAKT
jgi:tetratricopeptide (TPR) repeat protein